jgi:hypothetical protein
MLKRVLRVDTLKRIIKYVIFLGIPMGMMPPSIFYVRIWPYLNQQIDQIQVDKKIVYALILFVVILWMIFVFLYDQKVLKYKDHSWKTTLIQVALLITVIFGFGIGFSAMLSLIHTTISFTNIMSAPTLTETPFPNFTPAPTPENIFAVRPMGSISSSDYHKSEHSVTMDERGVAVGFRLHTKGFSLEASSLQSLLSRVAMYVDGIKLSNQSLMVTDASLPHVMGPFVFSWLPDLLPGVHEAKFQVTNDSGDVVMEYSWLFNITEK